MDLLSKDELIERIRQLELENNQLKQLKVEQFDKIDDIFSQDEYLRYGRQMIVPGFGSLESQKKLKRAKILVVGAGGLGCPALLYLSASGIGEIGIVDDDVVDVSNLHRQVLHTTDNVGMYKCDSAKKYINRLNPHVKVTTYHERLTNDNAFGIFSDYDLILDCTDAPAVRYLINDVAVILGKTVVSGSGLKTDGQWTILNFDKKGPCYRCFHPKPPSPNSVTSCQDGGVLGPAIGIIGLNMAMETLKVLINHYQDFKPFMGAYFGFQNQYRMFKMRNRQKDCIVCGETPQITREMIESNQLDYHVFCGRAEPFLIDGKYRITVEDFRNLKDSKHLLIDVRSTDQFGITALPNSINIPWDADFQKRQLVDEYLPSGYTKQDPCYVICRYGNDSQIAAKTLMDLGFTNVKDIIGGINKWNDIDKEIPRY